MRYLVEDAAGQRHEVDVTDEGVRVDGHALDADAARLPGAVSLLAGGQSHDLAVHLDGERALVAAGGRAVELRVVDARRAARGAAAARAERGGASVLRCPMPGRVVRVACAPGDAVAAGAGLVVVEAMKMENELRAPRAGTVKTVRVRAGDPVEAGAVLVELE